MHLKAQMQCWAHRKHKHHSRTVAPTVHGVRILCANGSQIDHLGANRTYVVMAAAVPGS